MIGGWTVAASLQPQYDPVADTVSALAAQGATDRWVMTLTFVLVGCCYIVTALALRPAGATGRLILIAGALAGLLVAANPEHPADPYPIPHIIAASAGLAGLVTWPAGAWRRGSAVPWGFGPPWPRRPSRCCSPWSCGSAPTWSWEPGRSGWPSESRAARRRYGR